MSTPAVSFAHILAPHLVIRRASAKLENSFVTANFASARAQLSKLERQRALLQNCGQIINKQQLFIFPNSLTIHQTPPLHNTFYFSNTWTKIQLRSDPVNMQPDETKCYPQRPITTLWPAACKMLSTSSGSPPLNSGTLSLHMERNCRIRRGAAGYWNVTLATTRRQALSCWSQANIHAVSANRILWVYAGFWWYHGILLVHLQDSVGAFGAKWLTKWLHHAKAPPRRGVLR